MTTPNNEFDYITGNFLKSVYFSLLALDRVDKKELLAIAPFSKALYELLYAATVTGIEEYLQHRLTHEVLVSQDTKKKFVKLYNRNKRIKNSNIKLSADNEDDIRESLYIKLVYHQLDMLCKYFKDVSNIDITQCSCWEDMKQIIKNRNTIIHHGGRTIDNQEIPITSYEVNQAYRLASQFIDEVEDMFVKAGKDPLIISPDE